MKRYGMIIGLRPKHEEAYPIAHSSPPPKVLHMIRECDIENYSIYVRNSMLFSYFEYVGQDFSADMAKMAAHPATQQWWSVVEPMQRPFPDRATGEHWAGINEVKFQQRYVMSQRNVVNCLWTEAFGQFCRSHGDHPVSWSVLGGLISTESLNFSPNRSYSPKRLTCSQAAAEVLP
jgi:L-rhamnose mutarotase